jgi:hypothetical protein
MNHRTLIDREGKYYTDVGEYRVVQKGRRFCGIYDRYGVFITSRSSWRMAIKTAKLLNEAFEYGREMERGNYFR